MKQIGKGAEAIIYLEKDSVLKDRIKKNYRIEEIDSQLRRSRTRRESKILKKLEDIGFNSPKLISDDNKSRISMTFVNGAKLRDVLEQEDHAKICKEIGKKIRALHDNGIIHGDLTTSNMIYKDGEIIFIDFGLSFFSDKDEDKAVDLHLLKQALESKHYRIWEKCFENVKKGYSDNSVLKRLDKVEERGRNKNKH